MEGSVAIAAHAPVDHAAPHAAAGTTIPGDLTRLEQDLLADLFAIVEEHADEVAEAVDRDRTAGDRRLLGGAYAAAGIGELVRNRSPSSRRRW